MIRTIHLYQATIRYGCAIFRAVSWIPTPAPAPSSLAQSSRPRLTELSILPSASTRLAVSSLWDLYLHLWTNQMLNEFMPNSSARFLSPPLCTSYNQVVLNQSRSTLPYSLFVPSRLNLVPKTTRRRLVPVPQCLGKMSSSNATLRTSCTQWI